MCIMSAKKDDERPEGAYNLTSLQIRDMVSYVHHSLRIIVDHDQKRLVLLVDYGPPTRRWKKSFEVWQRFVSQSRRSPFVNHQELKKVRRSRASSDNLGGSESQGNSPLAGQANGFFRPLLSAANRFFPPVKRGPFYWLGGVVPAVKERWKVHGLYGCLGFEVRLADVVGLNYLNELQTGGCLALEATQVVKREFRDLCEAVAWYRGGDLQLGAQLGAVSLGSREAPEGTKIEGPGQPWGGDALEGEQIEVSSTAVRRSSSWGRLSAEVGNEVGDSNGQYGEGAEPDAADQDPPVGSSSTDSPPAAQPLSTELSLGPGGFLEKVWVETAETPERREGFASAEPPFTLRGPLQVPECTVTSPAYHSAAASPSLARPGFETLSASCRASRKLEFGAVGFEEGSDPEETKMVRAGVAENGLVEKPSRVGTVTSAEVSVIAFETGSNHKPLSADSSAALAVKVSRQTVTKGPSPSASETGAANFHRPSKASSSSLLAPDGVTRGRAFLSSLQPSHSKLRFRRQRSRSLDDPVVKAVLDRVAEQAARIATFPKHSDGSRRASLPALRSDVRRHSSPSLVTAGVSEAQHWQTANGLTPTLPRLRVTARFRQKDSPSLSEPASPTETSPKPAPVGEVYTDRLVVFRFRDPLLPDALREAITTDQRLLKMLESGLPTWAILVQSYPALCHVYRPWMRRVAGYLYFIVSAVTVLIGFYDLYKNLPFVQDSLHRLLGPLYEWVDTWQMGARLGYLGTMLFLQNFQKAFRAAQGVARSLHYLGSVAFRPVAVPLSLAAELFRPVGAAIWGFTWEVGALFGGVGSALLGAVWFVVTYVVSPVVGFVQMVGMAGLELVYPLWTAVSSALLLPLTLLASLFSGLAPLFSAVTESFQATYASVAGAASIVKRVPARQAVSAAKAASKAGNDGVFRGLWMSLYTVWNDLLWKVFGALRRIVFGFLAFILEINKHRLSTYNHVVACLVEAENATWQCIIGMEEMIVNFLARSRSSLSALVRVKPFGRSPESCLVFYDAREYFDEMIN
ncbi:hypothetical protein KFL_000060510 [Klebsormidium nitens]|uniref:Uncharacterized protein n=1 Tax=Klebsormidium nitens TaxID=105231 RepID=A0A0U9HIV5_KLENI|nr:hypothetical protein KFL_000060510 [Klebsormidium nitens]|eukprot:GAQ77986.1 hypothetical protein KFL_000060510 [Klebsormidium nitens]